MVAIASFNKRDIAASLKLGTGAFKKVFCSAGKKWLGSGTLLPSRIEKSGIYPVAGYSFTLYQGMELFAKKEVRDYKRQQGW